MSRGEGELLPEQSATTMSHFGDMSWFALIISVALAFLSRRTARDRMKYAVICFFAFLLISVAIGWLMFPFSR